MHRLLEPLVSQRWSHLCLARRLWQTAPYTTQHQPLCLPYSCGVHLDETAEQTQARPAFIQVSSRDEDQSIRCFVKGGEVAERDGCVSMRGDAARILAAPEQDPEREGRRLGLAAGAADVGHRNEGLSFQAEGWARTPALSPSVPLSLRLRWCAGYTVARPSRHLTLSKPFCGAHTPRSELVAMCWRNVKQYRL